MRQYNQFNYPNAVEGGKTLLTGIRNVKCSKKMYICGYYEPAPNQEDQQVKSFVYKGCLPQKQKVTEYKKEKGQWFELYYPNSNVTNLYGPANYKKKEIQIVGNYTVSGSSELFGCMYQGPLNEPSKGKWTQLLPPFGDVLNVIAHSTMKNVVVGNYDTQIVQGKAFLYNTKSKKYVDMGDELMNTKKIKKTKIVSITAYGVWYNGHHLYTICGGYVALGDTKEYGYLVDWNSKKKSFCNFRTYCYDNKKNSVVTHFDGISALNDGYVLTGDAVTLEAVTLDTKKSDAVEHAFYCTVPKFHSKGKKKINKGKWNEVKFPDSVGTSGNSVYQDIVIGVYSNANDSTVYGYTSELLL